MKMPEGVEWRHAACSVVIAIVQMRNDGSLD